MSEKHLAKQQRTTQEISFVGILNTPVNDLAYVCTRSGQVIPAGREGYTVITLHLGSVPHSSARVQFEYNKRYYYLTLGEKL